jgi:type I restriction enzyme S subunit
MNAARLLALYERIAEAPDAVARLRHFVLDLAVRGKLVPQDAGDEPAAELLKRIAREKARLSRTRAQREQSDASSSGLGGDLDEVPPGWQVARLGDLIHLVSGQHLQPNEYTEATTTGLPYITGPSDFSPSGLLITRNALVRKRLSRNTFDMSQ